MRVEELKELKELRALKECKTKFEKKNETKHVMQFEINNIKNMYTHLYTAAAHTHVLQIISIIF